MKNILAFLALVPLAGAAFGLDFRPGTVSRTVSAGGSGTQANPTGVIAVAFPNVTTSTTTALEVVYSYNLPANVLNVVGRTVKLTFVAESANNSNNKRLVIYAGPKADNHGVAGPLSTGGIATTHTGVMYISKTGTNTQYCFGYVQPPSGGNTTTVGQALTYTETSAIQIDVAMTTPSAVGDLTLKEVIVEIVN